MEATGIKIVRKEIRQMRGSEQEFGELRIIGLNKLKGTLYGPQGTPYEGGTFTVRINIGKTYPQTPPKVRFITRIWHPNISSGSGHVCLDVLKERWSAKMSLKFVMHSLQWLLASPNPEDPLDLTVARQCLHKYELFQETAKCWTQHFAGGPHYNVEFKRKIRKLRSQGFDYVMAATYLSENDWNV